MFFLKNELVVWQFFDFSKKAISALPLKHTRVNLSLRVADLESWARAF